jgi:hypothetical protein
MKFCRAIFLLVLFLPGCSASASPEADFWVWFELHEEEIFNFENNRELVFDKLTTQMHKVDSSLTFEFGPEEDGQREFTISADGNKEAFPSVEKLYVAAPELKKWKVIKFRSRREPSDIKFQGVFVQAASVKVLLVKDGAKVELTVLVPGYMESKQESYGGIALLLLDHAIGEYDVEMHVGGIGVFAPSAQYTGAISLAELPKAFDELLGR